MVLLKVLKWTFIAVSTSYILSSAKRQTETLGSLSDSPYYSPDFYPNGTNLELPAGTMRYWEFGNENGNRVVLIHGISTGSSCYDKLARDLANNGHRVLVYDIWGRGYSQAPAGLYNEALFTSQLALLLQKVGWEKTDVVGVSLGGGIATSFTAFYPEMVNRLVLIAPAGLMQTKDLPAMAKVLKVPHLYEFIVNQAYLRPLISTLIQRFANIYSHRKPEGEEDDVQNTIQKITQITFYQFMHHPGFLRAFLATVLDFPFTELTARYEKIGQQKDRSTLIIWGDQDKVISTKKKKIKWPVLNHFCRLFLSRVINKHWL